MELMDKLNNLLPVLTEQRRLHWLGEVAMGIAKDFIDKFKRGAKEHRGDLGAVTYDQLLKELYQEQLDSLAYLAEIKRRSESMLGIHHADLSHLYSIAFKGIDPQNDTDVKLMHRIEELLKSNQPKS